MTRSMLLRFSERSRRKAQPVAEKVAHGIGVCEAAEVGDAIKRQSCLRQKLLCLP